MFLVNVTMAKFAWARPLEFNNFNDIVVTKGRSEVSRGSRFYGLLGNAAWYSVIYLVKISEDLYPPKVINLDLKVFMTWCFVKFNSVHIFSKTDFNDFDHHSFSICNFSFEYSKAKNSILTAHYYDHQVELQGAHGS